MRKKSVWGFLNLFAIIFIGALPVCCNGGNIRGGHSYYIIIILKTALGQRLFKRQRKREDTL